MKKEQEKKIEKLKDQIFAYGLWLKSVHDCDPKMRNNYSFSTIKYSDSKKDIRKIWEDDIKTVKKIVENLRYEIYLRRHINNPVCKKLVQQIEEDGQCTFMHKIKKKNNLLSTDQILYDVAIYNNAEYENILRAQTKGLSVHSAEYATRVNQIIGKLKQEKFEEYKNSLPKSKNGEISMKPIFDKTYDVDFSYIYSRKQVKAEQKEEAEKIEIRLDEKKLKYKKLKLYLKQNKAKQIPKTAQKETLKKLKKEIKYLREDLLETKYPAFSLTLSIIKSIVKFPMYLLDLSHEVGEYSFRDLDDDEISLCRAAGLMFESSVAEDYAADIIRESKSADSYKSEKESSSSFSDDY